MPFRFHVEDPWTVGFATGDAEGHFLQSSGGIDSVVVAQHEELAGGARFIGGVGYTKVLAAVFLRDALDADARSSPLFGDDTTATVRSGFLEAGRFRGYKAPQNPKHFRQARL